jgi:uncharacterized protein YbjQ (UPF0145 family)
MIISNIDTVPNMKLICHYGLVSGNSVRTRTTLQELLSKSKNVTGGEIGSYSDLLETARQEAVDKMEQSAKNKGANAIINVRFNTSMVGSGTIEVYVYGTAIKVACLDLD